MPDPLDPDRRVSAVTDDVLGRHDAVALAAMVRTGEVSVAELAEAAAARAKQVDDRLHAVAYPCFDAPRADGAPTTALYGVPTFVKDNTDVAGLPSNHGSEAWTARPARRDGAYTRQFLGTGLTVLGKSRLPEFGFNATSEFMTQEPVRNPWNTRYSVGASSGGSAALVASGAVPMAHANDGGGSIRIPAACAGLVGLKCTRGRHVDGEQARHLPINMVSEGVLTRTVRDTAAFVAAAEDVWRNPDLPPVGFVPGPSDRTYRIGLVLDTVTGAVVDDATRAAVEHTATLLETAGHVVEPAALPVDRQFALDFLQYWSLLGDLSSTFGKLVFDRRLDPHRLDGLTRGLATRHRRNLRRTPGALRRLRQVANTYSSTFERHQVMLSPVLAHTTPLLGHLSPTVDFDELVERLLAYVTYTPVDNIAGTPAISLPMGTTADGLPIGVQLSGPRGTERTLLELAFTLEAAQPFPRVDTAS